MGIHTGRYRGLWESVKSWLTSLAVFAAVTAVINAVTDSEVGRTFILNPNRLTWQEASEDCRDMNGTLATIDHVYVIPDLEYIDEWTLWIGLMLNSTNRTWEDGSRVEWSNWYGPSAWSPGDEAACASAVTSAPYSWLMTPCNETLPSLCEVAGGSCRFTSMMHASVRAFNDRMVYLSKEECLELCRSSRDLDCRSVEVNREATLCQLSSESRWSQPEDFVTGDRYWDYYHWTCMNGTYLGGVYVSPNGVELPSTVPITTEAITTTTTATTTEMEDMICVRTTPPTENETEEIQQEVKQLQTLTLVYKEQNKIKRRVSVTDSRPSATYVGSLAVGLVLTLLSIIVCLDLISLPRHIEEMSRRGAPCNRCIKKLKKRRRQKRLKNAMQFTEYCGRPPSDTRLVLAHRVPQHFRPQGLSKDEQVESTYGDGAEETSNPQVDQKVERHLQRIRRLDKEFGVRKVALVRGRAGHGDGKVTAVKVERDPGSEGRDDLREEDDEDPGRIVEDGLVDQTAPAHDACSDDGDLQDTDVHRNHSPDSESGLGGSSGSDASQVEPYHLGTGAEFLNTDRAQLDCVPNASEDIEMASFSDHRPVGDGVKHLDQSCVTDMEDVCTQSETEVGAQRCNSDPDSCESEHDGEKEDEMMDDHNDDRQCPRPQVEIRIEEEDAIDTAVEEMGEGAEGLGLSLVDRRLLHVAEFPSPPNVAKYRHGKFTQAW